MTIIEQIKAEVERLKIQEPQSAEADGYNMAIADVLSIIEESKAPEPFFYCKYGGTIPKCSDCKRNHSNSKYKTEEIHNWYSPEMRGTRMCSCYVPIEKSSNDLVEAAKECNSNLQLQEYFIKGGMWQKEQMMKDAVEERVQTSPLNGPLGISAYCCNFPSEHPFYRCKEGDKVKLIIVKED